MIGLAVGRTQTKSMNWVRNVTFKKKRETQSNFPSWQIMERAHFQELDVDKKVMLQQIIGI
jgi:hypothetical protein